MRPLDVRLSFLSETYAEREVDVIRRAARDRKRLRQPPSERDFDPAVEVVPEDDVR